MSAPAPVSRPVLSLALAEMMEDTRAQAGAMYLLAADPPVLEMAVMAGLPRVFAAPWERVTPHAGVPVADALRERRLIWIAGEEEMARRYPRVAVVLPYPFAMAALPVATGSAAYGAVFLTWPGSHPAQLSARDRDRLTAACRRLAGRLERACRAGLPVRPEPDLPAAPTVDGLPGTLGSVEAVRMVARLPYGLCSLDLDGRVGFVNAAAAGLLGVPAGRLLGTRLWSAVPWLNDPVYEDRYRAALLSQRGTSFVALRPPGDWLSFRLYPSRTGLSVRVGRARAAAGDAPAAPPAAGAPSRLVTVSHMVSLTGALAQAVGVRDVVQLVADEIAPTVGAQALIVLGSQAGRMRVLGHRGYPDPRVLEPFEGMPLTERTPGTHALRKGTPVFLESLAELHRRYPVRQTTPDGFAAWAFLPLIASGRPVGTCVLAYAAPHVFTEDERAVLTSLAGLVAQALDRAQLYDAKHRLAHGLQAALLPHTLPALPGLEAAARYLPATRGMDIGGDFYDLVPTGGGAAAAVIGDVQGHNVTAAGLMGQVRTAVRAYTAVGRAPEEVMRRTNRLLIDLGTELFASCLYLRIEPGGGRAVLSRAGHPPPLLRRPDGQVRVLDLAGGPLLGIDAAASYPATEVELAPGTLLALYTDGLVESPGVDLDDALAGLGRRLARAGGLPLDELADLLVRDEAGAEERADDIALLLLRVRGA
ncbi:SpoIIE family protein phosphatase [Streptomyces sp. JW3]|uniref:SpoIIE family protein phosphatase n=1 Tax=Streptomyces sp. JW3 TaxID=3456955 RepID=UPI003FA49854